MWPRDLGLHRNKTCSSFFIEASPREKCGGGHDLFLPPKYFSWVNGNVERVFTWSKSHFVIVWFRTQIGRHDLLNVCDHHMFSKRCRRKYHPTKIITFGRTSATTGSGFIISSSAQTFFSVTFYVSLNAHWNECKNWQTHRFSRLQAKHTHTLTSTVTTSQGRRSMGRQFPYFFGGRNSNLLPPDVKFYGYKSPNSISAGAQP